MRAARCERYGPPSAVVVRDVPVPEPGPGELLVGVAVAALGFATVLTVADRYQISTPLPFTPGGEFAGRVVATGAGVPGHRLEERVMGFTSAGALAEYVVAPVAQIVSVPPGLSMVDAAALPATYPTAYHALTTVGGMRPGEWVAVLGSAGGVGTACLDVAARLGGRVVAVASTRERAADGLARGAEACVVYAEEDLKQRLRDITGEGGDLVVDLVGGPHAEAALRATRWRGRFVSVGFASGEIPRIPLNLVLLKGVEIRGFQLQMLHDRMPEAWQAGTLALAGLVAAGLRPAVGEVHLLDDVAVALERVADRAALGRIVVDVAADRIA